MNKKASKLLYISSQQEDGVQSPKIVPKKPLKQQKLAQSTKYQNFKYQAYQMQENMLKTKNQQQQDYVLPSKLSQGKKSSINFVSQQLFQLENHTIKSNPMNADEQHKNSSKQCSLVQELDKLSFTKNNNQQQNPQKQNLPKTARNLKNILQMDIDEDSQDEQIEQKPKIVVESQQKKVNQNVKKTKQIQELKWDEKFPKKQFIFHRLQQSQMIICSIQRQKSGINYFLPQFDVVLKNGQKHVVSCKKQIGANFQYYLSLDNHNFSDKSIYFLAKIVGNFSNSVFSLVDSQNNSIMCTTRFRQQGKGSIVSPMAYQVFLLNQKQNYQDLAGANDSAQMKGLDQLYLIPINKKKITYFRNKKPQYCRQIKAYMLNFNGRVSVGSVKNFIIQDSKSGREVLMFGKGPGQTFNLYISSPLNIMTAMAVVMPHFASKMFQK